MIEVALADLLKKYVTAFKRYDLLNVRQCYQLPCALHTPDKVAYLSNESDFEQEFTQIFTVLKHANICEIKITQASFNPSINGSIDLSIDWVFLDDKGQVFTDFSAFYHLLNHEQQFKIINVVSHELSNSVELPLSLSSKLLAGLFIHSPAQS